MSVPVDTMSTAAARTRPAISVVSTLYLSAPYLPEFHARTVATLRRLGLDDYEIILVNDGSPDNTRQVALELSAHDPRITLVDLSRNFGHHKAIMTGLAHARGELVFLLDCDLEEDPELLDALRARMGETGCDVVYGVQSVRRGGWFSRVSGDMHYRAMRAVSGFDFPRNILTLRLMTGRYVRSLLLHRERELLISGIWHLTGYDQVALPVTKHDTSPTTYSLLRRFSLVLAGVISFSDRPLRWVFYTGLLLLFFGFLYTLYILGVYLLFGAGVSGFTSLILSIWIIGGLNFLFLGTIGLYIATIFSETKQRPYTIVRAVYRGGVEVEVL